MSLNLNWSGRFEDDGPQPPPGLSLIGGSEKEAMVNDLKKSKGWARGRFPSLANSPPAVMKSVYIRAYTDYC